MATPVVSTEGPLDFARGRLRPEWRDLLSTISRLLWREGLSAPRFALRSRRRKLPYAIALSRSGGGERLRYVTTPRGSSGCPRPGGRPAPFPRPARRRRTARGLATRNSARPGCRRCEPCDRRRPLP